MYGARLQLNDMRLCATRPSCHPILTQSISCKFTLLFFFLICAPTKLHLPNGDIKLNKLKKFTDFHLIGIIRCVNWRYRIAATASKFNFAIHFEHNNRTVETGIFGESKRLLFKCRYSRFVTMGLGILAAATNLQFVTNILWSVRIVTSHSNESSNYDFCMEKTSDWKRLINFIADIWKGSTDATMENRSVSNGSPWHQSWVSAIDAGQTARLMDTKSSFAEIQIGDNGIRERFPLQTSAASMSQIRVCFLRLNGPTKKNAHK